MSSPICSELKLVIGNGDSRELLHIVLGEKLSGLIRREVPAQKVSHKVLLGIDVGDYRVELEVHHQVQELPEEGSHGGVRGLLDGTGYHYRHVVHE